jgi:hypothetical protein
MDDNSELHAILLRMRSHEQKQRIFRRLKSALKPNRRGLTFVEIPVTDPSAPNQPPTWQKITDRDQLESLLLQQGKLHFAQAEGTPFTTEPLRSLCGYDGCTPFAHQITDGNIDLDDLPIPYHAKLLLQHMKRIAPIATNMIPTEDEFFDGYLH